MTDGRPAIKAAVMQPYFFPYAGYFQLIAAVDVFVVYDNIQYTKRGWINRNRILCDGAPATFSLPLKKASDYLDVRERELAADFRRDKLLNRIRGAYRPAPFFEPTYALVEEIVGHPENNLFRFLHHSISRICAHLKLPAAIRISSEIPIDHGLRSQDKVIALCRALGAAIYVNAMGGVELYSPGAFKAQGIDLKFLRPKPFEYAQFKPGFTPSLSIIDVLMFNPIEAARAHVLGDYELI
ncbi:MAG TPA: WbqC family protein [Steroidobacteraceae bacterium]|nr:WbqC family protein [Steroidobacteraceae bacterium]